MRLRLLPLRAWIIAIIAAPLVAATLLPVMVSNEWWIRIFDFPRAQIAAALAATIAAAAWLFGWRSRSAILLLAMLLLCLGYQAVRILPYTPLYPVEAVEAKSCPPGNRLRVMVANVLQENRNSAGLIALVREVDPDLVLLVETDAWWAARVAPLATAWPHRLADPRSNKYGMMLFSRLPLVRPELRYLIEDDIPSIRTGVRLRSGEELTFFGLHPRPPIPGVDTAQRDAELVLVGREVKRERRPALVGGDMNDVAWSDTSRLFQAIGGLLDPRIGRGLFPTFPADLPLLRWPLDHVFFNDRLALLGFDRLPGFGSDHLPIRVDLCLAPALASRQREPQTGPGGRRRAKAAIREGEKEEREEEPGR